MRRLIFSFSPSSDTVGRQEGYPACKKLRLLVQRRNDLTGDFIVALIILRSNQVQNGAILVPLFTAGLSGCRRVPEATQTIVKVHINQH